MLASSFTKQMTRRLVPHQPILARFATPAAVASSRTQLQARSVAFQPSATEPHAQTQPAKPSDAYAILVAQRLNRPISPHLSIYQPQITWYASALNRITGSVLSGGFYVFGAAYLVSPLVGWHLESASIAEWFGGFSALSKGAMKFAVSLPFSFHSWNGIRHLVWDTGRELSNRQIQLTGWTVVGLTFLSSGILAFAL